MGAGGGLGADFVLSQQGVDRLGQRRVAKRITLGRVRRPLISIVSPGIVRCSDSFSVGNCDRAEIVSLFQTCVGYSR